MEIFGWVVVAIIIGVPLLGIVLYNSLVSLRNQVKNAWRQIDVQLKRRHDLIPNLVEVVKDYMSYEQETLEKVIQAQRPVSATELIEELELPPPVLYLRGRLPPEPAIAIVGSRAADPYGLEVAQHFPAQPGVVAQPHPDLGRNESEYDQRHRNGCRTKEPNRIVGAAMFNSPSPWNSLGT